MNFKKVKFLALALTAVIGISCTSNMIAVNNTTAVATESSLSARTPSGWMLLTKYFKAHKNGVLKYGDSNYGVEGLNSYLFDYGYLSDYDGDFEEFTSETKSAVKKLQRDLGRTATGKFTADDWKAVQEDYLN